MARKSADPFREWFNFSWLIPRFEENMNFLQTNLTKYTEECDLAIIPVTDLSYNPFETKY